MKRATLLLATAWLAGGTAQARDGNADAGLPLAPARHLDFETDRGTWMSLDIAPDGRTIVFDLLGDLYVMPADGGRATAIATGMAFKSQPGYSPDGRWITYVSDRSGGEGVWIARADGSQARRIGGQDDDSSLSSPEWSADGKAVFVSRFRPDLNSYELWRYPLDGAPELLVPVKPAADAPRERWRSTLGASASRDGKWLYYARVSGGMDFEVAPAWTIMRRDLANGAETTVIAGSGGRGADREAFFRPVISHDGRKLAYGARHMDRTELRVRDLVDGSDHKMGVTALDQAQASSWQDLLPRYAFTPDGKALLLSRNGEIERRPIDGGDAERIAFRAPVHLAVGPTTRARIREGDGPVRARLAQAPVAAPDGSRIAFSALGALHVEPASGGPALALATGADPAFQPSWSPDGRRIAYVTWSEAAGGAIWTVAADGSDAPVRVSDIPAYYSYPVFTPDGASIVAVRSAMAARQQTNFEYGRLREGELAIWPAQGGPARVLTRGRIGARPHFSARPGAVFVLAGDGLNAVDLATGARERIVQVKGPGWYFSEGNAAVDDLRLSPDGNWLLAQVAQQLHLVAMPSDGAKEVDLSGTALPHRQLTDIGADYFEWARDGAIDWSVGAHFVRLPMTGAIEGRARPALAVDLVVERPRDRPSGSILLRGARAMTMAAGDRVIDDADILVTNGRIAGVGPRGSIAVPTGATIRDLGGRTVLPGFIDVHDHIGNVRRDVLSLEEWGLRARLAYGVTTAFDPSTLSIDQLVYQDLLDTGAMVGPRLRSTGQAIFSMNRFQSLDQVRAVLHRYRDAYGLGNIKIYRSGNRRVRQWLAIAARELGLLPTAEGALSMKLDLSQIVDGIAGNEHALAAPPLQKDVVTLLTGMRTSYTTTLAITNSGAPASDWFVADRKPWTDPKLRRFWTPPAIEQKLTHARWQPLESYRFPAIAHDAATIAAAGGLIGMGAHGELPGIGYHWEIESHVMGGMAPMAALHAATAGSAETIGRLDDLGTLEPGKLADLIILDRDPIADIRNTLSISQVMRDGRLYDANSLDEIWPLAKPLPAPWFAADPVEHWLPGGVER